MNTFGKTLIEIRSPHLYASFGTFYAKIGQSFEAQWVFEVCLEIDKSLLCMKGKCFWFRNSSKCLKTHCAANDWPIWRFILIESVCTKKKILILWPLKSYDLQSCLPSRQKPVCGNLIWHKILQFLDLLIFSNLFCFLCWWMHEMWVS